MKVLVSGSTGLVGEALTAALKAQGDDVTRLVRSPGAPGIFWNPLEGKLDPKSVEGFDAAVNLSGEGIANRRWNATVKWMIHESREAGARLLAVTFGNLAKPPKVFVSASAVGYYGDAGDEILNEQSLPGTGFLPEVCRAWEGAAFRAASKGIRTVCLRTGVVLTPKGGALAQMLPVFKLGGGGVIGGGRQWMSWISLDDVVGAYLHALKADSLQGPVNAAAPNPVTNREFTKTLGAVLKRPAIFPLPGFLATIVMGEMAQELLLASARVDSTKLAASGYVFKHPRLEPALQASLN